MWSFPASPAPTSLLAIAVLSTAFTRIAANAVTVPAAGRAFFGAWVNMSDDTPSDFNARMGHNASSFQFAQDIPVPAYDYVTGSGGQINETFLEVTNTNASIFLTVYPTDVLTAINSSDLNALGQQILKYQSAPYNRTVFLRYAPEMQGLWFPYGLQPTSFVAGWKTMYTAIKALAPDTVIDAAFGYPWGYTLSDATVTADQTLLDTSGDGTLDSADDAYSPWYPGDAYVDWTGISYYEKGSTYPYDQNVAMPNGSVEAALMGNTSSVVTPFYPTYCSTPARPCVFSEAGAAFHVNTSLGDGIGQLSMQREWWRDGWTNVSFWEEFEWIKMIQLFEFEKIEEYELRDYRISMNATIRAAFVADIESSVPTVFEWSAYKAGVTTSSSSSTSSATTSSSSSSASSDKDSAAARQTLHCYVVAMLVAFGWLCVTV